MKIAGSFLKIGNDIKKVKTLNDVCDNIHIDVMDGVFTQRATMDFSKMEKLNKVITKPKDVHLMVEDIYGYVDLYKKLNPRYITFHFEATTDVENIIDYIKSFGIKVGMAINPNTEVKNITDYLDKLDLVLVMSVFPGEGGQKFIDITEKIDYLKKYRKEKNLNYIIEVDGGIDDKNILLVSDVDLVVVGSFITDSDNYKGQIRKLRGEL